MRGVVPASATEVFKNERRELSSGIMVKIACRVEETNWSRPNECLRNPVPVRLNRSGACRCFDSTLPSRHAGRIDPGIRDASQAASSRRRTGEESKKAGLSAISGAGTFE